MLKLKGQKGRESRDRLLAAATCEFAYHGYHATKVSDIVLRAGLTQAAFYLYFPSKEAIYEELTDFFRKQLQELLNKFRLPSGLESQTIPKRVSQTLEEAFRFLENHADLARMCLFQSDGANSIKQEITSLLEENLRAEQQASYFIADIDVAIIAECLMSIIERLTLCWLFSGEKDAKTLAVQATRIILYGIIASEHEHTRLLPTTYKDV